MSIFDISPCTKYRKATSDKVLDGFDKKSSEELKKSQFYFNRDHDFEVTVKLFENQYFSCFDP